MNKFINIENSNINLSLNEYDFLRQEIIKKISNYFFDKSYIQACWLGGSDANNESDIYSDIDLFLCVDDLEIYNVFNEVLKVLLSIWKIDFESDIKDEWNQKIKFYHIAWTPESLIIDIWLIKKSERIIFEENHPFFKPKIIFDKENIIKFQQINKEELLIKIKDFINEQKDLIWQSVRLKTYINRWNYIEATNYYIKFVYLPLIWLLRVKYTPYLYNWGRIHISRHFPSDVIDKLENLMKIQSLDDLDSNLDICKNWFWEILKEIDTDNFKI